MTTRRALLASTALVPLLAAGQGTAWAQVETPGEALEGTPVAPPPPLPDLSGVTPLPLTGFFF